MRQQLKASLKAIKELNQRSKECTDAWIKISATTRKLNTFMAIGVVWVGDTLNAHNDGVHKGVAIDRGVRAPNRANDSTKFLSRY